MELIKSKVSFDQEAHKYTLNGVGLQGITGMLSRQLFPDKYKKPDYFSDEQWEEVLNNAAKRGTLIHEACEVVDELGVEHESQEAHNYIRLKAENHLVHEASEYLVSDNEHFASCIDKVYRIDDTTFDLGDIKTTYKLDTDYVSWQLSIYAFLFERQNPEAKVRKLFAIWLRNEKAELVEVQRYPDDLVAELLMSEISGTQFIYKPAPKDEMPIKYQELEESIVEIVQQQKYWEDQKKLLMNGILGEMIKAGAYKWKGENIQLIRKKDTIRKTFDKESFDKDYPGLYEKYIKETPVVGSLTLKIS